MKARVEPSLLTFLLLASTRRKRAKRTCRLHQYLQCFVCRKHRWRQCFHRVRFPRSHVCGKHRYCDVLHVFPARNIVICDVSQVLEPFLRCFACVRAEKPFCYPCPQDDDVHVATPCEWPEHPCRRDNDIHVTSVDPRVSFAASTRLAVLCQRQSTWTRWLAEDCSQALVSARS